MLGRQAQWLARYPAVRVTVEGHADERGTREYNLALGARRANAVKEYLVGQGVSAARVETVSYGKERPICTESNEILLGAEPPRRYHHCRRCEFLGTHDSQARGRGLRCPPARAHNKKGWGMKSAPLFCFEDFTEGGT